MRRLGCCLLLAALAAGCVPNLFTRPTSPPGPDKAAPAALPPPFPTVPVPARPPGPVTEEQVNEQNYRERCEALRQELDREEQGGGSGHAIPK